MRQAALNFRNLLLLGALLLSACGFHLRGLDSLPFKSLHLQDSGAATLAREVQLSLKSNGVAVLSSPDGAEGSLELMSEHSEKLILSLSGNGRVREYQLIFRAVFRIKTAGEALWGEPQTIEQRRDYTFNDAQTLAKEAEEARLYKDMRADVVREIMRRVSALSKQRPASNETAR
jgi:LPS-assembly lipoprotein